MTLRLARGDHWVRHANPMSHSPSAPRRWRPTRSLGLAWLVLGLPALFGASMAALTIQGNLGYPSSLDLVLPWTLPVVALFLAAVTTTAATGFASTMPAQRSLTAITAVLLAAVAAPLVLGVASSATQEWCEGQPGGRGGASVSSQADVPALCR